MSTTTERPAEIEIKDTCAIPYLRIEVPRHGGVVILKGPNGSGKSTALKGIGKLLGGEAELSPRDGTLKGTVTGMGVKVTITTRQTRATGEPEFTSIENRFAIDKIVNPGIKDREAANRDRIKRIVALTGFEADHSLFYEMSGGQAAYEALCGTEPAEDLPALVGRVKRKFESKARDQEEQAETQERTAATKREATKDINLKAPADERKLSHDLETAIAAKSKIEADAKRCAEIKLAAAENEKALKEAATRYQGPSATEANAQFEAKSSELDAAQRELRKAREAFELADKALTAAHFANDKAGMALQSARQHERLLAGWKEQIDAADALVEEILPEAIDEAAMAVAAAKLADRTGHAVREARLKIAAAEEAEDKAKQHRTSAQQLRAAGKAAEEILSEAIAQLGTSLRVSDGMLVTKTRRGDTYFDDLSEGEAYKLIGNIGVNAVGEGGALIISQTGWEALDPSNQAAMEKLARDKSVVLFVAEASDGELRAEVFSGNGH